jgi:SAM-dependent methyltransferase
MSNTPTTSPDDLELEDLPLDDATAFFEGPVHELWRHLVPPEMTQEEVAYLADAFGPSAIHADKTPKRLLDLGSGAGRHALGLARRGFHVTAVDLSAAELGHLAAAAKPGKLPITTVTHDLRDLESLQPTAPFDGAYCFGNTLAYFPPDELAVFLDDLARLVVPGGRIVLDDAMVAESFLSHFEEQIDLAAGGVRVTIDNDYDIEASRVVGTYAFTDATGATTTRRYAHWCLTTRELLDLVDQAGFDVEALADDTDGSDYGLGSPRLILVASRRTAAS